MTHLFTKTRRDAPSDEVSKNAQLLIRAGFIYKEMAGVYAYLPLGLRVFNKIVGIIREEMNAIGSQELSLTALQSKSVWEATNRWDDNVVDVWFKTQLKSGGDVGLGFTHEEPLTNLMTQFVESYRDLPFSAYQFQTKFRNETRAKSGIMRCREFVMKDMYSFCADEDQHNAFYEQSKVAYMNVFNRAGLGDRTYITFASGGSFSKYSHEFQTITDAGEDISYVCKSKNIAINEEVFNDEVLADLGITRDEVEPMKTVEVGNIFSLGTKFSDAFNLQYVTESGERKPVIMGSYGIGPGRLMGAIAELLSDDRGLIWPLGIAPFTVHIVQLGEDISIIDAVNGLVTILLSANVEYLHDDRTDCSAGQKLNDADLMGMPLRVVVSNKSLASGGFACKTRKGDTEEILSIEQAMQWILDNAK